MTTRMLQRRDYAAEWAAVNPILGDGEIGFVKDTGEIRIGDGVTHFNALATPYLTAATAPVRHVAGRQGDVLLTPVDVPGVYYAGNPPPYPVTTVAGRGGAVVLTASDVSGVYYAGNPPPYPVTTVAGRGGAVVLTAADVGAGTFAGAFTFSSFLTFPNLTGLALLMASGTNGAIFSTSANKVAIVGGIGGFKITNNAFTQDLFSIADDGTITLANNSAFPAGKGNLFGMTSGNQGYLIGSGGYLQFRGGPSGTIIRNNADTLSLMQLNNTGDLNLHGTTAGVLFYGRDNDAQNYINYVNSNIWRVYSSTAGSDRLSVDINGHVTAAGNVIATGLLLAGGSGNQAVVISGGATNHSIELGRQDGVASTPFIDFHAGATAIDYDVRLLASNPTGALGKGYLTAYVGQFILNSGDVANTPVLKLSGNPVNRGAEAWFHDTGIANQDKFIRINSGHLQVVNNAYTIAIMDLLDNGNVIFSGTVNDSSGRVYSPGNPQPGSDSGRACTFAFHLSGAAAAGIALPKFLLSKAITIKGIYAVAESGASTIVQAYAGTSVAGRAALTGVTTPAISTSVVSTTGLSVNVAAGNFLELNVNTAGTASDVSIVIDAVYQ